ncbi:MULTISPECIES: hypothetical protein [Caproicibacterium]|jgi:hypothetical protein|uniref:Uncharacterized protein n=1 Tax=Caproicibacterium argilliputei TaxID=3030016 RepID=A0AA97D869_9FIRM|nr:hypothetical protein [Caproicibacterium argilliputei]WOC32119.1 hypothetical protein PXC00_13125 [Caproicibacterium argilliputei]
MKNSVTLYRICTRFRQVVRDRRGTAFPLVIALTMALMLILCGVTEYMRLNIIASGVRDALESGIITTVNDNYANVYHGVREGYGGGYQPDGSGFEEALDYGDIYRDLDKTLGTESSGGKHVKYTGDVVEYTLSGLSVSIRNAPLAPSSPENAQKFVADATIRLEVPVRFGGKVLPPMSIDLKVQAGYTEVF